jgi:hypothetical protein
MLSFRRVEIEDLLLRERARPVGCNAGHDAAWTLSYRTIFCPIVDSEARKLLRPANDIPALLVFVAVGQAHRSHFMSDPSEKLVSIGTVRNIPVAR